MSLIGKTLGSFEIISQLGKGGMGEVYRAKDSKLGRDVAIKVLPEEFAKDADRVARFQREAKLLASLNHPNIAAIYGLEESHGMHFLVLELIEGDTLADQIKRDAIPVEESLKLALQIAEALEAAHEKGVIHRDLKPANIKVTPEGKVKVLDFGLAKAFAREQAEANLSASPTLSHLATQQGIILGTAAYMSPEQARGKPVDKRTDIWAFGCVLYEMLTGEAAFQGEDVSIILAAVIRAEPDWSRIPAKARRLLKLCLEKDQKKRLRDIGDANHLLEGAPESAPVKRPWLAWGVAAAFLLAFTLVCLVHFGEKPPVAEPMSLQIQLPEKASFALSGGFVLSPDGRHLAFYASDSNGTRIWIRSLDSQEARPLSGTESSSPSPVIWSPDSRSIAFGSGGSLKKIDVSGGPPTEVCKVTGTVVGGDWNRDGVIIFGSSPGGLMRVPAVGGAPSPLLQRRSHDVHPVFLPDGRHFLYKRAAKREDTGVYAGSLDINTGEQLPKLLLKSDTQAAYVPPAGSAPGQLLFMREGTLMAQPFDEKRLELTGDAIRVAEQVGIYADTGYFSASANGVLIYLIYMSGSNGTNVRLTWVDREGKALGNVGEPGFYADVALAPKESRAVAQLIRPDAQLKMNLLLLDLARNVPPTPFTFEASGAPVWSPDGLSVVFRTRRGGAIEIHRKLVSGTKEEEVLLKSDQSQDDMVPTSLSSDGQFLLYSATDPKTKSDLWVLRLQSDPKPVPLLHSEFNERQGQFSPNLHWIAYVSDQSGNDEIWVMPFSPGSIKEYAQSGIKWMVSRSGGTKPCWKADNELFFRTKEGKIISAKIASGPDFQVLGLTPLFQTLPNDSTPFDASSDGKRFLIAREMESGTPMPFTVILNWQARLKK